MTIIGAGLPGLLARLHSLPDPQARLLFFGAAVTECGGTMQFPAPGSNWGPHLVELSLMGILAAGTTPEEALANWTACARRQVENLCIVARAEAVVNHPAPQIGVRDLRHACDTVVQFSHDRDAIARAEQLLRATERAS